MSANPPQNYIYRCDKCQFITSVKRDYQRHIASMKHAKRTETNAHGLDLPHSEPMSVHQNSVVLPSLPQPCPTAHQPDQLAFIFDKQIYKYCEKCGNKYHSKSGLWKHRKTCDVVPVSTTLPSPSVAQATTTDQDFKTMMMDMLKNNQEFQHKLMEMVCSQQSLVVNAAAAASAAATAAANAVSTAPANYTNSNNYNGTTNSHNNNTFNMQFFLNEQCKDAMNITDFASSIHLKVSDLDDFASIGYVENTKITNAVRVVEHKNIVLVNEWAKQNPRCENSSTKENTQYINMSRAVLDGDDNNIAKVIKKVAKEVVIEKGPP